MLAQLQNSLSPHRFTHSLGVMETAVRLAKVYLADVPSCRLAGMLHDCAKGLGQSDMLKLIERQGISLYRGEESYPGLLHAPAGAALAKEQYGVSDEEVLSAIRKHTLGAPQMSLIDDIIFVSDFIEPNREPFEGLEEVRKAAFEDLNRAKVLCRAHTARYCEQRGLPVFSF